MANLVGVDYYRVVSETGEDEWSQVYVKTAFDQEELSRFGSIFGVVKLSGKGDLVTKGMGLIGEVDKWCDNEKHKGDVAGLLALLSSKMANGAFAWVFLDEGGSRRVKVGARPGNSVAIVRGGQRVWLTENGDGRVVAGEIKENDKLYLGGKEAVELIDQEILSEKESVEALSERVSAEMMKLSEGARAALVLLVKSLPAEAVAEAKEEIVQRIEKRQVEKLASDRVVGAEGLSAKLAVAKMSWKDLTTRWQQARRLPTEGRDGKKHRLFLLIGAIFLVVLGVSVGLGLIKVRRDTETAKYKAVFEPLEKKREEAENLFNLNPVGARDLLRSVRSEIEVKKGQFAGGSFESKITDFEKNVQTTWEKVSGEQKASLDSFFDLGLIRSQMKGDRLTFNGKELLVLDGTAGLAAKVSYPDKKQEVILGKGEGKNWVDVGGLAPNNLLLRKAGLTGVLSGSKSDLEFDASVVEPVAIDAFASATYVLDKGASEIWRFGLSGGTIGERRRWLAPGVEADLAGGVDMAIDSDIWVGLTNGKIVRFRRGQFEKFNLSDVPEDFKIKRLAVNGEVNQVAVLDSEKGRIVFFAKDTGAYTKQIIAPEFANATDLVWVSEKELMILVGDRLYLTSI